MVFSVVPPETSLPEYQHSEKGLKITFTLISLYCNPIKGKALLISLQNQNGNGTKRVSSIIERMIK